MKKFNYKVLLLLIVLVVISLLLSLPCAAQQLFQFDVKIDTKTQQKILHSTTQVSLTSVITLRLLKVDSQGEWWGLKADNVRLNKQILDPSYEVPFVFHLNKQGVIRHFWFPPDLSAMHTNKLKGLAYYFQWPNSLPEQQVTEHDNTGVYDVKYYALKNGMMTKEKLSYQAHKDYQIKIVGSQHQLLKADKFFARSAGTETLLFEHYISMMNLLSEQNFKIKVRDIILPSTLLDLPNDFRHWQIDLPTDTSSQLATNDIAFQRAMLVTVLANKDLTSIPSSELALQLLKFAKGLDVIPAMLAKGQIDKASSLRLFNALGQIDNDSSQQLLFKLIINQEIDASAKFLAMRALSKGHSALTMSTAENLLSLLEESSEIADIVLKSSLMHGIGSILGNTSPNQYANDVKDALLAKMRSESSDSELSSLISSIGNTRNPEYIVELEEYKNSASSEVRSALAETLGRMKSEHSHIVLADMLSNEVSGSTMVQSSILQSLTHYPLDDKMMDVVLRYIDNSSDEAVRFDAITLISAATISKKHKDTLQSLLTKETNRKNFIAIANLINQ